MNALASAAPDMPVAATGNIFAQALKFPRPLADTPGVPRKKDSP